MAPGLYGAPGLHTPEDLISTASRIVMHCRELQLLLELSAGAPNHKDVEAVEAGLVRGHHEAVSWLRPLAEHCAAHHSEGEWREAAGRAVRALQAVEELLAEQLAERPRWIQLAGLDPDLEPKPETEAEADDDAAVPRRTARQIAVPSSGGRAAAEDAQQRAAAVAADVSGSGGDVGGGGELRLVSEAVSRAVGMTAEERRERRQLEALEGRLVAAFRAALADPRVAPVPLVVLHDSEVRGDPLLARHVTPATEEEVAAARARSVVVLPLVLAPEAGEEMEEVEGEDGERGRQVGEVELGPVAAATRRALTKGGRLWSLRLTGPLTSLLLAEHPSSQVRRAVAAVTHGSQAAAALRFMDLLRPLRDELAVCLGQPSYAHLKMAGSVAADPRVALALLGDLLSAVRPLADQEVAILQELSLRMALEEADQEEGGGGRGRGRGGAGFGGWGGGRGEEGAEAESAADDPLDLRGSVDFLTAMQRPPPLSAEEWRELAPYFTLEGLLQGLGRQMSHLLGVELHATPPGPGELWRPGSVVRLELREAEGTANGRKGGGHVSSSSSSSSSSGGGGGSSGGGSVSAGRRLRRGSAGGGGGGDGSGTHGSATAADGTFLGVLYVYLDPDCDLPYTVLVRHGYGGFGDSTAPWLQLGDQAPKPAAAAPAAAAAAAAAQRRCSSGACAPHVALHLPAGQLTHGSGGYLVPEHPGLIRTLAHEMGHALHYILSYSPGSLPDANACYSSTDWLELPSHILERWAADPRVVSDLSCHALSGARLPSQRCTVLASAASRHPSWLELQQHALAAAADLLLHLNGFHVDLQRLRLVPQPPRQPDLESTPASAPLLLSSSSRQAPPPPLAPAAGVLDLESTPSLDLVSALWAAHSSLPGGAFQPTRGLMAVLPGLLHNAAAMYAYPAAQLVAAAVWERHFAVGGAEQEEENEDWGLTAAEAAAAELEEGLGSFLGSAAAARCGRALRQMLLQVGDAGGAAAALEALLGPRCVRHVRLGRGRDDGGGGGGGGGETEVLGVIPDLAHEAFQGADPLVF